jgi:Xaa-Pro aminopeptidase
MAHFHIPEAEIARRIKSVQDRIRREKIEALLIVQRVDLFYFTGTAQSGYLYIPDRGTPTLFIRRYLPRAHREAAIGTIVPIATVKELPEKIVAGYGRLPRTCGMEFDVLPVREFHFLEELFKGVLLVDGSQPILAARQVKSAWELAQMKKTAAISSQVFDYIRSAIRPDISEIAFSGLVEAFARSKGHAAGLRVRHYQTEGYAWHILSGKSGGMAGVLDAPASGEGTSAAFPCGAGNKDLMAGEPIMVDIATVHNGYHMDETRMFAIQSMPAEALKASRAAIEIHDAIIAALCPGQAVAEIFDASVSMAKSLGYGDQFLGPNGHKVSFVGHGIGLELVEPPFIAKGKQDILEAGMVLAIEPKFVFDGQFSAGIESVVAVTAEGADPLSTIPRQIFIC